MAHRFTLRAATTLQRNVKSMAIRSRTNPNAKSSSTDAPLAHPLCVINARPLGWCAFLNQRPPLGRACFCRTTPPFGRVCFCRTTPAPWAGVLLSNNARPLGWCAFLNQRPPLGWVCFSRTTSAPWAGLLSLGGLSQDLIYTIIYIKS